MRSEEPEFPARGARRIIHTSHLTPHTSRSTAASHAWSRAVRFSVPLIALALAGCGSVEHHHAPSSGPSAVASSANCSSVPGGGYYLDDGPGANPPDDLVDIPNAVPRLEPINLSTSRPYTVLGKTYTPMTQLQPYHERGYASWYGRRYNGKRTSSGEIYDMYAMTAAHPTLPIPSYARVTNVQNHRSVVVRINDRGPFLNGRIIDLSFTAACKLGIIGNGSGLVEVDSIIPGSEPPTYVASADAAPAAADRSAPSPANDPPAPASAQAPAAVPATARTATTTSPAAPTAVALQTTSNTAAVPDAAPAPDAAPPQVPVTSDASGVYLQFGAFSSKDNADDFLARLQAQLDSLGHQLHIHFKDGLYKVHAGPYRSRAQARSAATRISAKLGIKPMVLVR
ncbi:MAG TPA: septal ring lytic transglycosylase RlpA family protein [Burkholderiales bacterium]|nr:septal ring lytic transglycosylase RlpA family protein [Burkholderiales bacterium]